MKKLLVLTLGIGFIAASCGTKEKQMSSSNTDSTMVDTTMQVAPPVADTMTTTMPMDSAKVDSMAAPASR
ncbi:cytochrome C551 [Chryseobacterium wangxinyae]|uniref:cytochrome C551 n=1 Tax=unclassified Chryseobacterium TaxID=2593645 RepID=UPI002271719B|nr:MULTISPECIES: cytochrome C551 [unclassified Chryseobacterium]MCY0967837.1 cytochrome C551 [Chryseobacterium sp. CY353]MCY0978187.1 cytochrome C551 [Chryseobacterium sp. CY350]WBZ95271.1 cytochrome C551 [Chryseobacterium sp. CY350]